MGPLAGLGRDLGIADPVELTDVHHIIITEVCRSETQKICERMKLQKMWPIILKFLHYAGRVYFP